MENYPFLFEANWAQIYQFPYKICTDTYIQSLQYRILNRYINCNENLFWWKINNSPQCSYCNGIDNLEHFFFYCSHTKAFWSNIKTWIENITSISISLTVLEVLLCIILHNDHSSLCNYIILHAKKMKTQKNLN